ncbi:MAG TPA: AraC family transcriptional regulator, partial [Polyangiaceae bacterium]|nr:AraC family transcriptional regulator [Polyangiaceae bacterium]
IGRLFFWLGRCLYIGPGGRTALHSHHALQIAVALDGELRVRGSENADWVCHFAIAVAPDAPHQLEHDGRWLALLYADPEMPRISSAAQPAIRVIDTPLGDAREELRACWNGAAGAARASQCAEVLLNAVAPGSKLIPMDSRVAAAVTAIQSVSGRVSKVAAVADSVGLSESRLAHLFRDQVGLPLRRYALWVRLCTAVQMLGTGRNLSDAAHASGFADHAHFTRTFRQMFGLVPSQIAAAEFMKVEPLFSTAT